MSTSEEVSRKSCGGLTRSEVANLLQPVIALHGIEVKDDRFEFPSVCFCAGISESELLNEINTTAIFYKDITSISPFKPRIEVLLQCDELYVFSTTDNVTTHINTYSNGENTKSEKPISAQDIAGNIWDGLEKTLSTGKEKSE